jgi:hypothetical protein
MFGRLIQFLTSFGHVNLSLVTFNLGNLSPDPGHIARLSSVPGLTTTVYIALGLLFSDMVRLEHDGKRYPIWIQCTLDELDISCNKTKPLDQDPAKNLGRFTYAYNALWKNKSTMVQWNAQSQDEDLQLLCLSPGDHRSKWSKVPGQHSVNFYYPIFVDSSDSDEDTSTDDERTGEPAESPRDSYSKTSASPKPSKAKTSKPSKAKTSTTSKVSGRKTKASDVAGDHTIPDVQDVWDTLNFMGPSIIVKCKHCDQPPWKVKYMTRSKLHVQGRCQEDNM